MMADAQVRDWLADMCSKERNLEAYASRAISHRIEVTADYCRVNSIELQGLALSKFQPDRTEYHYVEGLNSMLPEAVLKRTPQAVFPCRSMPSALPAQEDSPVSLSQLDFLEFSDAAARQLFGETKEYLAEANPGFQLLKVLIDYERALFYLANSNNVSGYGQLSSYCPGIEFHDRSAGKCRLFFDISHQFEPNLIKEIIRRITATRDSSGKFSPQYVILSPNALSAIIHTFTFMLTGRQHSSLLDLCKEKHFAIDIAVDSPDNQYITGNIDGGGNAAKECFLVFAGKMNEDAIGRLKSLQYRFDFRVPPINRPHRLYLTKGVLPLSQLLNKYRRVAVIDNIQGIEQGLNPRTLDFTGIAGVSFYADGVKAAEGQNAYTGNIINILGQIIDKSRECAYGATGFLRAPWVVIENAGGLRDIS